MSRSGASGALADENLSMSDTAEDYRLATLAPSLNRLATISSCARPEIWWSMGQFASATSRIAPRFPHSRSAVHTSELQFLMRSTYALFSYQNKKIKYII